ncbi:MAG TPA: AraC family transcriptional regulator [Hanamia sp.]
MKRYILTQAGQQQAPAVLYIIGSLLYVQFYAYTFITLRNINTFRSKISNHFSEFNKVNLNWLSVTIILFMIVIGIGMVNSFIRITPLTNYSNITLTVIIFTIFLFITQILFKAIQYPSIFEGIKEEENAEQTATISPAITEKKEIRYAGSSLSGDEKELMKQQLVNYMQQEKPYLEPQLMLEELADMLKIKPRILSQVINESFNQNFFDFINRYRIEEAKRLLGNPADKKITVLEVLYQVGFNSKSSFNTLFKRYTGVTPSEYKKSNASL